MLLSAVSVLVVAQSISEIPEGLMNNPVFVEDIVVIHSVGKCLTLQYSGTLCDFKWYSFVWIYQHGWAHCSRDREGKYGFYGPFSLASTDFIHIFVPFVC